GKEGLPAEGLVAPPVWPYPCLPVPSWRALLTWLLLCVLTLATSTKTRVATKGAVSIHYLHPPLAPDPVIHMQIRLTSGTYSRMQLTVHATRRTPHGASRFLQAMSA
ncbi:unnamed protein product, partial [Laminaria digitata]